ncbi:unnamed protein product [Prorocentrum cordatum]|uniref:Uncharacterized protein n=1 Tax=Prorocentrum cordatum TaxID=2364126 RepID=A0ABN9T4Q0_9DINO|nr:unnamed protein product [Polarella glacialis]
MPELAMPSWYNPAQARRPEGAEEQRSKQAKGSEGKGEKQYGKLLLLVAQLLLATTRGMADLAAAVFITYEMSAVQGFPAALVAAGKQYDVKSKELADRAKAGENVGRGSHRGRGPPHLHIFVAGIHYIATRTHAEGDKAEEEKQLKADAEEFWTNTVVHSEILKLGAAVKYVRLKLLKKDESDQRCLVIMHFDVDSPIGKQAQDLF